MTGDLLKFPSLEGMLTGFNNAKAIFNPRGPNSWNTFSAIHWVSQLSDFCFALLLGFLRLSQLLNILNPSIVDLMSFYMIYKDGDKFDSVKFLPQVSKRITSIGSFRQSGDLEQFFRLFPAAPLHH